jgi:hypothetical protein
VEQAAQAAVEAAEDLFGLAPQSLHVLGRTALAGLEAFRYEQRIEGLPVLGSRFELRFSPPQGGQLRLTWLCAAGLQSSVPQAGFDIERRDAAELARIAVAAGDRTRLWALARNQAWFVTTQGALRPVWQADVWDPQSAITAFDVWIDAADGSIHQVERGVLEGVTGTVDGRGMLSGAQNSGVPATLPMANEFVTAIDTATGVFRVTTDGCEQVEVAVDAAGMRVAWVSTCDGDSEIWTAAIDGSNPLKLTDNLDEDRAIDLSDDGAYLFFVSDRDGDDELFRVGTDGSGLVQLTSNTVEDHSLSVSGDGTQLAFLRGTGSSAELYALLVGAPTPVKLTADSSLDEKPRISSDGSRVVWVSWADGDAEVCAIDFDGSSFAQLTVNEVEDTDPDVTADGARVVFASKLPAALQGVEDPSAAIPPRTHRLSPRPNFDLFEGPSDGSGLNRLSYSDSDETQPSYAAGGGCVAYVTTTHTVSDIEIMDVGAGVAVQLTNDAAPDRLPRVGTTCASGVWLAHDGDKEVFTWDLSGPGAFLVTTTNAAGAYSLPVLDGAFASIQTRLRGLWARVIDLDPSAPSEKSFASAVGPAVGVDLHLNSTGFVEGPTAQVTTYAHVDFAHTAIDTIVRRPPLSISGPLPIDVALDARANFPQAVPNAFYSPARDEATFFMGAGPARPNTAYDTVIYHEYGHFLDDMVGGIAGDSTCEAAFATSEGVGDVTATYLGKSDVVGAGFFGPGTWIRNYGVFPWTSPGGAKGVQYGCEECPKVGGKPEAHAHGAALAGFAWDLRAALGAITAEDLLFGAIFLNPPTMQAAVDGVFTLASTPAFGGSGDPSTSPLAPAIYVAAAKHGFNGPARSDFGSWGCTLATLCPTAPAVHRVIGTEWLGAFVDSETSCEPPVNFDDDGVVVPPHLAEGSMPPLSVTMSVDPALKGSGRYGPPLPLPQFEERRVFLNGWLFIENGAGGFDPHKVFGTGTPTGTLAYNPDTWAGSSLTVPLTFTVPSVPVDRLAILRVRFDYGEDVGRLKPCLSDPSLMGPCGLARFGEVEDYQVAVLNVP